MATYMISQTTRRSTRETKPNLPFTPSRSGTKPKGSPFMQILFPKTSIRPLNATPPSSPASSTGTASASTTPARQVPDPQIKSSEPDLTMLLTDSSSKIPQETDQSPTQMKDSICESLGEESRHKQLETWTIPSPSLEEMLASQTLTPQHRHSDTCQDWLKSQSLPTVSQVMRDIPPTDPTTKRENMEKLILQIERELGEAKKETCEKEIQCADLCAKMRETIAKHEKQMEQVRKEYTEKIDNLKDTIAKHDKEAETMRKKHQNETDSLKERLTEIEKKLKLCFLPGRVHLFRSKFSILSPFADTPITIEGIVCPTAEHLYQARKAEFLNRDQIAERIRNCRTPEEAKSMARYKLKQYMTPEWHEVKREVMLNVQRTKAEQCEEFRQMLLDTKNKILIHNMEHDEEWGCGHELEGDNLMGEILMELRADLWKQTTTPKSANTQGDIRTTPQTLIYTDSMLKGIKNFMKEINVPGTISVHPFPGKTAAEISRALCADLVKLVANKPSHIVFHAGTNDLTTADPKDVVETHKDMITNVSQVLTNTHIVISGILHRTDIKNINTKIDSINHGLAKLESETVKYVNHNAGMVDSHKFLSKKGLHLNANGKRAIAHNLKAAFLPGLADQTNSTWLPKPTPVPTKVSQSGKKNVESKANLPNPKAKPFTTPSGATPLITPSGENPWVKMQPQTNGEANPKTQQTQQHDQISQIITQLAALTKTIQQQERSQYVANSVSQGQYPPQQPQMVQQQERNHHVANSPHQGQYPQQPPQSVQQMERRPHNTTNSPKDRYSPQCPQRAQQQGMGHYGANSTLAGQYTTPPPPQTVQQQERNPHVAQQQEMSNYVANNTLNNNLNVQYTTSPPPQTVQQQERNPHVANCPTLGQHPLPQNAQQQERIQHVANSMCQIPTHLTQTMGRQASHVTNGQFFGQALEYHIPMQVTSTNFSPHIMHTNPPEYNTLPGTRGNTNIHEMANYIHDNGMPTQVTPTHMYSEPSNPHGHQTLYRMFH